MKKARSLFTPWLAAAILAFVSPVIAAESSPTADLQALVTKVNGRIAAGQTTPAALAPELAAFDALLAKYAGTKTEEVAHILVMKAMLYAQVFEDETTAIALFEKLKADFPATDPGKRADEIILSLRTQLETNKVRRSLVVGAKFPEFSEPDLFGKPVSLAAFKGKVVLLDFWATWCGPCIAELPHLIDAYRKHHASGFDIVGISLDRPGDRQKLIDFTKKEGMPWAQIFDGAAGSKLATKYGVTGIPTTYLIGPDGTIAAANLRGPALEQEVARLLAKR